MDPTLHPTRPVGTQEGYDRWAPSYDAYDNALIALEQPVVESWLRDVGGLRIADIGCGTGRYSLPLARAGARVTGVDFSQGMLEQLRDKPEAARIDLVEHDLGRPLPLDDAGFDLVLCCLVLEHVPDLGPVVAELARICAPGGSIVLSDLHPEMVRRGVHARFRETADGPKMQIDGAYHPISEYVMTVLALGLRIEEMIERDMDAETVARSPASRKWLGQPLLFAMKLDKSV